LTTHVVVGEVIAVRGRSIVDAITAAERCDHGVAIRLMMSVVIMPRLMMLTITMMMMLGRRV